MRLGRHTAAVIALTGLSLLAAAPLLGSLSTATAQGGLGDDTLFLWWLGYVPHAVLHGGGLGFTEALNAPRGVNVWWQTSVTGPSLILAPVTLLAGTAAALNLLTVSTFLLTSLATYALGFRLTRDRRAAFIAATLTGFGPYVTHHASAHPNLAVWAIPPLLGLVGHELLVRQRTPWGGLGLLLAFLVILQFTLSTEVLSTCAITAAIALTVASVTRRAHLRARLGYVVRAGSFAAAICAVALAGPLYELLAGRQHLTGPAQQGIPSVRADLLSSVVPSSFEPGRGLGLSTFAHPTQGAAEATAYLGLPLIIAAVIVAVRYRREPLVRVLAVTGLSTWVLSLGSRLIIDGHDTGIPLPAALFTHLPLLRSIIAERFSAFTMACAALLLAVGIAHRPRNNRSEPAHNTRSPRQATPLLAGPAVIVASLWPLALPLQAHRLHTPRWFRDTAAIRHLPPGNVLTVPLASSVHPEPMVWAAATDYRINLIGGYVITPDRHGNGTFRIARPWPEIEAALTGSDPPDPAGPAGYAVREAITRDDVSAIVIPQTVHQAGRIAAWIATATGTTVHAEDDVLVVFPLQR